MNVCIKHKTKPPKILKFYLTVDWNWHHLQIFISIFNYNTDIKLPSNHHLYPVCGKLPFRYLLPFCKRLHAFSVCSTCEAHGSRKCSVVGTQMEFLSILQKSALLNLSHVGSLQNEVKSCSLRATGLPRYPHVHIFIWVIRLSCTAKWFPMSIAKETSTVIKEDSLLMQLLKVKGEQS